MKPPIHTKKAAFFLIMLLCIIPFALGELSDGTIHAYTFDTNAQDENGTLDYTVNGATHTTGYINDGYDFEKGTGDYLSQSHQTDLEIADTWSVNVWFNWESVSTGAIYTNTGSGTDRVSIGALGTGMVGCGMYTGAWTRAGDATFTDTGNWHMITMTNAGGTMKCYIDGVSHTDVVSPATSATSGFMLGSAGGGGDSFDGLIDEVTIWGGTVLTQAQVTDMYNKYSVNSTQWNWQEVPASNNFSITATDLYNNTLLTNFNATITYNNNEWTQSTTTGTITTNITENTGLVNITVRATNYFLNTTLNHNTSSNHNSNNRPWTRIGANNALTNATINSFTITYNSTTYNSNTGETYIPLYNTNNANVSITTNGTHNDDSTLLNASPYLQAHNFSLYPNPSSVQINIYDADSGATITENITITVSGISGDNEYTTTTGNQFVSNLNAGNYTISFENTNYSRTSYLLTTGTYTFQTLNAYLSKDTGEVIFSLYEEGTTKVLEGAAIAMARSINSTLTTVESRQTDISGRTKFQYVREIRYRFTISLSGYETKQFFLDPILFDEYNVYLTSSTTQQNDLDMTGVAITLTPEYYTENSTSIMELVFTAPSGNLQNTGYVAIWNGGFNVSESTNAYGATFTTAINISNGVSAFDTVNITYWYQTVTGTNHTYTKLFPIIPIGSNYTFINNRYNDWGLGVGERVMVTNMIGIVIAGAGAYYTDPLIGLTLALIVMGYLSFIGFIPLWALVPTFIAGFVLIVWRSNP